MKKIKTAPFHPFLLPFFFILHVLNEYYGLMSAGIVFQYLGYYLLLSIVLFGIGRALLKSNIKAALFSTILLAVFFFWGVFHDYIKSLSIPRFFTSYSFLLPLFFILLVILFFAVKRTKYLTRATFFLNLLLILIISLDVIQIAGKAFSRTDINDLAAQNPPLPVKHEIIADSLKPDIFFIVFDEYASSLSLEKYFGFNNYALDSMLKSNGFYVAKNSRSNYNSTPLSVSSTFNLQYLNEIHGNLKIGAKGFQKGFHTLHNSFLPKFFKLNGYKIISNGVFPEYGLAPQKFGKEWQQTVLFNHSLLGRIKNDILWNFIFLFKKKISPENQERAYKLEVEKHKETILKKFPDLINALKVSNDTPRFMYAHFLIPHLPFCLDRDGNPLKPDSNKLTPWYGYTEQILFTNKLIKEIMAVSKSESNRPRIVIIEGDHGYRGSTPRKESREAQFMNLSSFYFSDGNYQLLFDSISPINTFRIVLNKYFQQQLPILKDTSIFVY
ncbi:sulfatase-like hydrolase/transferase [Terrimonas sp.]|uniref:sulfatase-like hydrolase/transferase n=1 Tax=Terrimonas sp. TaxID=1914338 RepID=UPI001056F11D|nr:sulfatase-like hydrolase/transferase [Terrimonas sp.]